MMREGQEELARGPKRLHCRHRGPGKQVLQVDGEGQTWLGWTVRDGPRWGGLCGLGLAGVDGEGRAWPGWMVRGGPG